LHRRAPNPVAPSEIRRSHPVKTLHFQCFKILAKLRPKMAIRRT
jgi:hypothetical protein